MYHFNESIQDTKGNALIGFYVKAVDSSGALVDIFADESSTPISAVSGIANSAKVDSDGMVSFWVASGTYHLDIYNLDALTLVRRETSLQMIEPLDQDTADARYVQISNFDAIIAGQGNSIISGCGVAYNGLLGFTLSAGTVYIGGTLIDVASQTISLSSADATNPRIDVLYVDDTGTFGAIAGDPAIQPSQPSLDATTQLFLTFVLVPAAATTLTGITTETIYNEGTEWTGTVSGTGFTLDSTNNPNSGTKCLEATSVVSGAAAKFARGSSESFDGDGSLLISIRSKATWSNKRSINLRWRSSGVTVGAIVTIKDGSFGFNSSLTGGYQQLVIAKSLFAVPAGANVDEFWIGTAGTGGAAIGFYVDPIKLQNTGTTIGGPVTQTQADARYLQRANNLSDVSSVATARTNLGATTVGANLFTLANPSAITFPRYNANNTVSALSASAFRTAIGAGTGGGDLVSTNNLSDVASASTARTNLGLGTSATMAAEWAPNFTATGDVYIPAVVAMTIDQGNAAVGTGTLAFAKSTTAAPGTFTTTTLPATLQAGAWLKVSASSITGFVATHLKRTA